MKYKLNEKSMFSDITDGIAVIINSESGIYYGMNSFSTNVYSNIIAGVSTEKIIAAVEKMANVPANFEEHFTKFIDDLVSKNILLEGNDNDFDADLDEKLAVADEYTLVVKEFTDAQELLLADPIHEVKEEVGWTPEKESIGYTKEETAEREKKVK